MKAKDIDNAIDFILEGTITEDEYDLYRDLHKVHGYNRGRAMRTANAAYGRNQQRKGAGKAPRAVMRRQYLNVPYDERAKAKELGAKWDPEKNQWYAEVGSGQKWSPAEASDWIIDQSPGSAQPSTEKVYLNIPFKDKDIAKKAGARWDNQAKKWFWPRGSATVPAELKSYLVK